MTEDGLIAAFAQILGGRSSRIVLGIGDDAAAWRPSRSHVSVITTDALLEGVHFTREHLRPHEIGYRALASNLSDIAAMGARPVLATLALGIPKETPLEFLRDLYCGIAQLADSTNTQIAGGDIIACAAVLLSFTVVGEVRKTRLKTRSGARPGDVIATTGPLGASRAGLDAFNRADVLKEHLAAAARAAHVTPVPRLREGAWLAASHNVHAMMDISDGLSTDVHRLCAASACGAVIEAVPVDAAAAQMAQALGEDAAEYAAAGGEDFELLVCVQARAFAHLAAAYAARFGRELLRVGEICEGSGVRMRKGQTLVPLLRSGWDHVQ